MDLKIVGIGKESKPEKKKAFRQRRKALSQLKFRRI